ncbi:oligosaccharide flippase family protein [Pallidibacillus thermolactis]|jgi:O-antigen/teichoic acid export membrane protein|uniref:oligosaccharide flippase family protein n=1 Tax=Pallidibacillus thermolactis TaxID=251051 RepID=UPI0021DA0D46|nr:oligosaccharide flippase family protein [Pallidibacillus thermolactis]MCU9599707.1 oligosaccharide flippase family protein [Pallidibacillus thermolactis subsp. kokeshiiformis]
MPSIKKNFLYNSVYQILLIIIPLITTPYIARVMGPSGVGIFSYTHAIAHYITVIAMLGTINYGTRSIAKIRDNKEKLSDTFWGIYYFQLLLALILSILYILYVFILVDNNKIIFIIQFIYVISAAFDTNWFCAGLENFKLLVVRNIIIRSSSVIAIFIFVKSTNDLWVYTFIMASSVLVSQLAIWPYILSKIDFKKPEVTKIKKHIKPNLILFVPVIAISIYTVMDKIMLGLISDVSEVGYYSNSERIISVARGIVVALGTVMLPRMSNLVARGENQKVLEIIRKSMIFVMFLGFALTFFVSAVSPTFVPWFLGEEFKKSALLASLLSIIIVFTSWANVVRTQYLIPYSRDKVYIVSVCTGAVVNFVINLILIPSLHALGAVIGTIFAELSVCIVQTYFARRELYIKTYLKNTCPFLIFGIIMFLAVRSVATISLHPIVLIMLQFAIGTITYLLPSIFYIAKVTKEYSIINGLLSLLHTKYRIK